jgi:hypothetical protein
MIEIFGSCADRRGGSFAPEEIVRASSARAKKRAGSARAASGRRYEALVLKARGRMAECDQFAEDSRSGGKACEPRFNFCRGIVR